MTAQCPQAPGGPAHQEEVTKLTGALHRGQLPVKIILMGLLARPGQEDVSVDPEIHDDEWAG